MLNWRSQLNFLKSERPEDLDEITIAELEVKGNSQLKEKFSDGLNYDGTHADRQQYAANFRKKHNLD